MDGRSTWRPLTPFLGIVRKLQRARPLQKPALPCAVMMEMMGTGLAMWTMQMAHVAATIHYHIDALSVTTRRRVESWLSPVTSWLYLTAAGRLLEAV